jgi:GTPase involved in cell partitioning and DNA repair
LKEKFYSSPFEKRAKIKRELKTLQDAIFEKRDCGTIMKIDTRNEELLQRLQNPTGPATNPQHLASSIKEELRAILNGSRKMETGDTVGDI